MPGNFLLCSLQPTGNGKKALAAFVEDNFVITGLIASFCCLIAGTSAQLFFATMPPPRMAHILFIWKICYTNFWFLFFFGRKSKWKPEDKGQDEKLLRILKKLDSKRGFLRSDWWGRCILVCLSVFYATSYWNVDASIQFAYATFSLWWKGELTKHDRFNILFFSAAWKDGWILSHHLNQIHLFIYFLSSSNE